MINEKEVVDRVESFYRSIVNDGNDCLMITKDGYFVYRSEDPEDFEYYPSIFELTSSYKDKLDSMLSPIEKIFEHAILTAIDDAQKAIFERYPNGIIHIDSKNVNFTETGEWENHKVTCSLYDMLSEILDVRSLLNAR